MYLPKTLYGITGRSATISEACLYVALMNGFASCAPKLPQCDPELRVRGCKRGDVSALCARMEDFTGVLHGPGLCKDWLVPRSRSRSRILRRRIATTAGAKAPNSRERTAPFASLRASS